MPYIEIHENARKDLLEIEKVDIPAAATIAIVLEESQADPRIIDTLTTSGSNNSGSARLGIKRWESMWQRSTDLWRFRVFDTPATKYRVIYGYHWPTRNLCVLAVVHKESFDYDDLNSDIAKRIINDWRSL